MKDITVNPITNAINELAKAGIKSEACREILRKYAASGKVTRDDLRLMLTKAFYFNAPKAYAGQYDFETGKGVECRPGKNESTGALVGAVREELKKIFGGAEKISAERKHIKVPRAVAAAAAAYWAVVAAHGEEGALKLADAGVRQAKANAAE